MHPIKETWGEWARRTIDQHLTEFELIAIAGGGCVFILHAAHDSTDKDLVQIGRDIVVGALACLYGFMRGQATAKSSQPPQEQTLQVGATVIKETVGPAPKQA